MSGRILTQLLISFLLGIMVWRGAWGWIAAALWIGFLLWKGRERQRRFMLAACMAAGFLGALRFSQQQERIAALEALQETQAAGQVIGVIARKEERNQNTYYYLKDSYIIQEASAKAGGQILVNLNADLCSIGDIIEVKGKFKPFSESRNEGNFDEKSYYYSKHILARMEAETVTVLEEAAVPWKEGLYQLRRKIQQSYASCLPEQEAGVLCVMALGDKELLDSEVKKLYQQSGVSHMLAISGLHVSILGMGMFRFLRKCGCSYRAAGMVGGLVVVCFGEISGMELSTRRAVTMFLLMLLGQALGMAYDSVTALSFAGLLQLWENPYCLWNTGFLFSYAAVLAVVVAARIVQKFWRANDKSDRKWQGKFWGKLWHSLADTTVLSGCIQLVTLPLTVYYYYEFPVYGIVMNVLLLPFMSIALLSGISGGLVGALGTALSGSAAAGALSRISQLLLFPAKWILGWNEWVCRLFGSFPGAVWVTGRPTFACMIGYYALLSVCLYGMWRLGKRREGEEPTKPKRQRARAVGLLLIPAAALMGVLLLSPAKSFQVCFLDVGQGDGIFIQSPSGSTYFIDGGSTNVSRVGEYRILPFLKCRGVKWLDGWFVSHGDEDHVSGLKELWEEGYEIHTLFLAQGMVRDEAWEELCGLAKRYRTNVIYLAAGDCVGDGELEFDCLWPWEQGTDRNQASMTLRLKYGNFTALFGGDIAAEQEQALARHDPALEAMLFKASHHGSNGSNSAELLEAIRPKLTVVSCAAKNTYGHPGAEAVERLAAAGSRIFYTKDSGQITVMWKEDQLWVEEFVHKQ